MSEAAEPAAEQEIHVELRDPYLAAFLAWLVPGAGHIYQGRWSKGCLFMVCILATFFYGLILGDFKVVYASTRKNDVRLAYFCQVGVGLPAMPALIQAFRVNSGRAPLFDGRMAPPKDPQPANQLPADEFARWNAELNVKYELGTLFTMAAGLLNVLAIMDALWGPLIVAPAPPKPKKRKRGEAEPAKEKDSPPKTQTAPK